MQRLTPARLLAASVVAAVVVFSIVQDRTVAAGVGRYITLQRAARSGRGSAVTVAEVMGPAVDASVRRGVWWGGGVLIVGLGVTAARSRSRSTR